MRERRDKLSSSKQEHKAGAAIAVREHIKAIISLPVHSPETKPLQSPAGNHPRQRHLCGTSPQGCRAEGMICLYSAIKALILSLLFPSCAAFPQLSPSVQCFMVLGCSLPTLQSDCHHIPCPQYPGRAE